MAIREELSKIPQIELGYPPKKLCTDNGAMIAAAGVFALAAERSAGLGLEATSTEELG